MTRPPRAPKRQPLIPADVARLIAIFGPLSVMDAFCRALDSPSAEALETAANRNAAKQTETLDEEQPSADGQEEDVIDKVVRLYDVY